jgi:hypothetical protein
MTRLCGQFLAVFLLLPRKPSTLLALAVLALSFGIE